MDTAVTSTVTATPHQKPSRVTPGRAHATSGTIAAFSASGASPRVSTVSGSKAHQDRPHQRVQQTQQGGGGERRPEVPEVEAGEEPGEHEQQHR